MATGYHIYTSRDHGCCMDQGTDRCWPLHSIWQPDIEGYLGRFAHGTNEKTQGYYRCRSRSKDMGIFKYRDKIKGTKKGIDKKESQQKTGIANSVYDKGLLTGISRGLLLKPKPYQ